MNVNLVMIVKNEERSLGKCLKAAAPFVDHIVIVDTGSTDKTLEIINRLAEADKLPIHLYHFEWINDFAAARNFALEKSDSEWESDYNLVLDADEYLRNDQESNPKRLRDFLSKEQAKHGGNWTGAIKLYDQYCGDDGINTSIEFIPRLAPSGIRFTGSIHEQLDANGGCYQCPISADHDGYLLEGKGERNLIYLMEAVKKNPEDSYLQYQTAATLRNMKRLEESLPYFEKFYALECMDLGHQIETGYIKNGILLYLYTLLDLKSAETLEKALVIVEEQENRFATSSEFYFFCGLLYMNLLTTDTQRYIRFLPMIEQSYKKCLEIGENPDAEGVVGTGSFKALYNLGTWYEVTGQERLAKECYRKSADMGYEPAQKRI